MTKLTPVPASSANGPARSGWPASSRLGSTAIEPLFDQLAALGAALFDVPMCLVSIIDAENQTFIGRFGVDVASVPRILTLCEETLVADGVTTVADLGTDPRYHGNPFVQGPGSAHFYAGAPLVDTQGGRIGTFCIVDTVPHMMLHDDARALLLRLAEMAAGAIETRRHRLTGGAAQRFVETTAMAIITADQSGAITSWNGAAEAIFGYPAQDAIGRNLTLIVPERFREAHDTGFARLLRGGTPTLAGKTVEVVAIDHAGREFPIEMTLTYWSDMSGRGFGAHILDITERRAREARLQHLAHHDELTGLLNRRGFIELVERTLAEQGRVTVLALDLDGFKAVNDAFGHAVGDAFLQALAVRLTAAMSDAAVIGRIGGDEFALLLSAGADLTRAGVIAQAMLDATRDPLAIAQHRLPVGISIGIAVAPVHAADVDELMIRADLALFRAKREGGRTYRIFDSAMGNDLAANRAFKIEIGRAGANMEWELLYQPQIGLRTGALVGAEALLRWQHPERGLLLPAAFLPLLETHAAAFEVGCWTIDRACAQVAEWRTAGLPVQRVSVNLFAAQIRAGNLADIVAAALQRHGLRPTDLELEITETIALRHDRELEPLRALHAAGVAIAFDDFGTGFASLTTLKHFPLSRLKIDRSFVADLDTDPHSAAIVEGVIAIGHSLDLCVIAEGIETFEQERTLALLGCDEGQGYRYGRPMAGSALQAQYEIGIPARSDPVMFPV